MKIFLEKIKACQKKQGITVLVASLVASILLAIGLSIFNTTVKDLFFAATAKESEIAFYAADAAAECTQYWDFKGGVFATSSKSIQTPRGSQFNCLGYDITNATWILANDGGQLPPFEKTSFSIEFSSADLATTTTGNHSPIACADVTLRKDGVKDPVTGDTDFGNPNSITTISVLGHNTSCSGADASSPRRVERGVQFSY